MKTLAFAILAAAMLTVVPGPLAQAAAECQEGEPDCVCPEDGRDCFLSHEGSPDCEEKVDNSRGPGSNRPYQPWIGYGATADVRQFYYDTTGQSREDLNTCEGEHWDGQDTVQPGHNPGDELGTCEGDISQVDPSIADDFWWANCMNDNPNEGGDNVLVPVGTRVSARNDGDDHEAYVGLNIFSVGRVALYVGAVDGKLTTATYLRDNTPGNVLASAVSAPGLTRGNVGESDCDQRTYQKGAYDGTRGCTRDNTAVTLEAALP